MSSRRWQSVAAALLAVTTTGCSGSSTPTSQPTPTPSVTASPTADANALARAGALAAYRGFRRAQVAAEAVANAHNPDLARYSGDKALAQERANLLQLARAGIVLRGAPVLNPVVDSASPEAVTLHDCVDTTHWQPVYKATGKSAAAPGQPARVLATVLARPYGDGWLIVELTTERSRPC